MDAVYELFQVIIFERAESIFHEIACHATGLRLFWETDDGQKRLKQARLFCDGVQVIYIYFC